MIEFEEPEKNYVFEGSNISNVKPKARLIVLLLSFFTIIGFFIKNDYDFNFLKNNKPELVFICSEENSFSHYEPKEDNYAKAKKALEVNLDLLEGEVNFQNSGVTFESIGKKSLKKPAIYLNFSDESTFNIPETMCGFKVNVIYK